eukprot:9477084-Pyramimonas_sp.AAC.1
MDGATTRGGFGSDLAATALEDRSPALKGSRGGLVRAVHFPRPARSQEGGAQNRPWKTFQQGPPPETPARAKQKRQLRDSPPYVGGGPGREHLPGARPIPPRCLVDVPRRYGTVTGGGRGSHPREGRIQPDPTRLPGDWGAKDAEAEASNTRPEFPGESCRDHDETPKTSSGPGNNPLSAPGRGEGGREGGGNCCLRMPRSDPPPSPRGAQAAPPPCTPRLPGQPTESPWPQPLWRRELRTLGPPRKRAWGTPYCHSSREHGRLDSETAPRRAHTFASVPKRGNQKSALGRPTAPEAC